MGGRTLCSSQASKQEKHTRTRRRQTMQCEVPGCRAQVAFAYRTSTASIRAVGYDTHQGHFCADSDHTPRFLATLNSILHSPSFDWLSFQLKAFRCDIEKAKGVKNDQQL